MGHKEGTSEHPSVPKKVKLDHDFLCMAVLVQEIVNADYAFVNHTTNPSSGDSSEIYAEVLGYPCKPIGLFIKRSNICRSDSNGEDLEGYAGAGLYDSVSMDEEDKVVVDYSCDPLIVDFDLLFSYVSFVTRYYLNTLCTLGKKSYLSRL